MDKLINNMNKNFINKKLNNINKQYFYNRNTLHIDLIKYLNQLNQPFLNVINNYCNYNFSIINYERVNLYLDCNNNKLYNCIFYISNRYENYLINTEIYLNSNNISNINYVKVHNSEDTNMLNQSRDILNTEYKNNYDNYKPVLDDTSLEYNNISSIKKTKLNAKEYNKSFYNYNKIPNFYKCNFELTPEINNNNYMFQGHNGLKSSYSL